MTRCAFHARAAGLDVHVVTVTCWNWFAFAGDVAAQDGAIGRFVSIGTARAERADPAGSVPTRSPRAEFDPHIRPLRRELDLGRPVAPPEIGCALRERTRGLQLQKRLWEIPTVAARSCPPSGRKDSDRYKVAKCIQAEPVFCGFGRSAHSKVISVSVLRASSASATRPRRSAARARASPRSPRYAVIPVARNVWWQVDAGSPAATARRLIMVRTRRHRPEEPWPGADAGFVSAAPLGHPVRRCRWAERLLGRRSGSRTAVWRDRDDIGSTAWD